MPVACLRELTEVSGSKFRPLESFSIGVYHKNMKISKELVSTLVDTGTTLINQYLPNKESLINTLIEREADRHLALLEEKYSQIKGQSFETIIETLVLEIASAVKKGKLGIRVILTSTFAVERLDALLHARRSLVSFVEKVLQDQGIENNSHLKAYTIVSALGGLVETMAFKRDESISEEDLTKEATKLILAYCS